jgi:CcmD family protein
VRAGRRGARFGGRILGAVLAAVLMLASPSLSFAQAAANELAQQTLGRPYWYVFVAYAVVWLLVAGWVISIARRLSDVEKRLGRD